MRPFLYEAYVCGCRRPFGLINSLNVFDCLMERVLLEWLLSIIRDLLPAIISNYGYSIMPS